MMDTTAPAAGIKWTHMTDTWALDETDMSAVVAKIAAKAKDVNPDAIMVMSIPSQSPSITKGLRDLGIDQQLINSPAATSLFMFAQGVPEVEGMLCVGPGIVNPDALPDDYPGKADMVAFNERYKAAYKGVAADFYAGQGYDVVNLIVNAMKTAGGDDKAKVRDALEATKAWQGMQGIFTYSPADHVGIHGGYAEWRLKNGGFEFVQDLNGSK